MQPTPPGDWRPGAAPRALVARAELLGEIRRFFAARGVLEVETPLLTASAPPDPHLASFALEGNPARFLHTSPEFAMKRLLAAGSGPVYQLCKCFRQGESGRWHNPEFTMLEWYRPGFDYRGLMAEVEALCAACLGIEVIPRRRYREVFEEVVGLNPHRASAEELALAAAGRLDLQVGAGLRRGDWLDLLMTQLVEPSLGPAVMVYDFPREQAALSELGTDEDGSPVARRFELYVGGVELANGYQELLDADVLAARWAADGRRRRELGLPPMPCDERLLAAQRSGLPACAGVALGVDRLLMLQLGASHIDQVLSFSSARL